MGVYKEGKNWKAQVYYKDWQEKPKAKKGSSTTLMLSYLWAIV